MFKTESKKDLRIDKFTKRDLRETVWNILSVYCMESGTVNLFCSFVQGDSRGFYGPVAHP